LILKICRSATIKIKNRGKAWLATHEARLIKVRYGFVLRLIMKNRAKCRKCGDIIESFHADDYVTCTCDEIAVDGGAALRCYSRDWSNFVRVDDENNEIIPKVIDKTKTNEKDAQDTLEASIPISSKELLDQLQRSIDKYDDMPENAMMQPVLHFELVNYQLLVSELFRRLLKDDI